MACSVITPGTVVVATYRDADPIKNKICICVCEKNCIFFIINTIRWKFALEAQLLITPKDLPYLKYDSYVDLSKLLYFDPEDIRDAQLRYKYKLKQDFLDKIKNTVESQRYLSEYQKELVKNNL